MKTQKEPKDMAIKEFMEWYVSEYDDNALLPSDFAITINRLEGYTIAKKDAQEFYILNGALEDLKTARNFFFIVAVANSIKRNYK